jgi:hypothetical protein
MDQEGFKVYTVYDHPTDYPDYYVVRTWSSVDTKPTPDLELFMQDKSLDVIREKLRSMGLVCIDRDGTDDGVIVESWI